MKTIILLLTTILFLYNTLLFAANPSVTKEKNNFTKNEIRLVLTKGNTLQLAPVTPSEAAFEDADVVGSPEISDDQIKKITPITPKEASFEDVFSTCSYEPSILLPLTPREATFEDSAGK